MNTKQRGKWGGELALDYLKRSNYTPVTSGYRSRFGEIDIIVKNSDYLVFAEVKLRKNKNFAYAREYVNKDKQRKIISTAKLWLSSHETKLQPRFDVIEIYARDEVSQPEIIHIKNAFQET